jgi:hypothetical protein
MKIVLSKKLIIGKLPKIVNVKVPNKGWQGGEVIFLSNGVFFGQTITKFPQD